jgi:hypothetical protein
MSKGYDHDANAHFSDSYYYGTNSHFDLKIKGENFEGDDYGAGHHFSGRVQGRSVEIFSYSEGRYFNYSV